MVDPLISAGELVALQRSSDRLRVLDVRWSLGGPPGRDLYREGHIPGAVYVDLETQLARKGQPTDGRHPLPEEEALQDAARAWGINDGDTVVVYDDVNGTSAARAWWLLRYAGMEDVRVLDGALSAWKATGHPLQTGDETVARGSVELHYGHLPVLTMDEAGALADAGVLLDARAPERFRGESEPVDPKAGHIPGARNAPASDNVDADGKFLPAERLKAHYAALGVRPDVAVGVYCGSGVTAAHDALALTIAGLTAALYPGSWSQWSNHPERPVATGD